MIFPDVTLVLCGVLANQIPRPFRDTSLSKVFLMTRSIFLVLATCLISQACQAELKLSPIFGDSMVLQREQPIHIWGWTKPSTAVTARIAGKEGNTQANEAGRFDLLLDPLPAGGPHSLTISADETKTFQDVLIGEVWLCSGQSNMAWPVSSGKDSDLELLTANDPNLRLISVPQVASQEPLNDFDGRWESCTPETVRSFSAVGYYYGRQLQQTLGIPVGLIDNAWGGSAAEAWVPLEDLEKAGVYGELLKDWDEKIAEYSRTAKVGQERYQQRLATWQANKKGPRPRPPKNLIESNKRPANLYNGVLHPVIGYTLQGVIWYQGEANASRAYQYRHLFPLMIQTWRTRWGQGDFPFYWVQLADFRAETQVPGDSDWAELREAQTMAMSKLPNTGQAVIVDLGESADIHPRNKQDVAKRLARWPLAKQYGFDIAFQSPLYRSVTFSNGKANVVFDHVGRGLDTFDIKEPLGFTVAGADQRFVTAEARIIGKNVVEVWSPEVAQPVSVRFGWADNPVRNLQSFDGLPVTPFRTDQWTGVTEGITH